MTREAARPAARWHDIRVDQPESISVPCPRCDRTLAVTGVVVGDRLHLHGGGRCAGCGCTVSTEA